MKLQKLYNLRIILKSGKSIVVKKVKDWLFSGTEWNVEWHNPKDMNLAWIHPSEIAAVEIVKSSWHLVWM